RERIEAVDADRIPNRDRVKPPAPPGTAGDGTELLATFTKPIAKIAGELGRQWPLTHASRVSLRRTKYAVDAARTNPKTGTHTANRRIRRRHVRVGAVIDVEERALRTFEHDRLAFGAGLMEEDGHISDPRLHSLPGLRERLEHLSSVHRRLTNQPIPSFDVVRDCVGERGRISQIADTNAAARDFVFIRGPDAARGRADLSLASPCLTQQIQIAVVRKDQMRLVADAQPRSDRDPGALD